MFLILFLVSNYKTSYEKVTVYFKRDLSCYGKIGLKNHQTEVSLYYSTDTSIIGKEK